MVRMSLYGVFVAFTMHFGLVSVLAHNHQTAAAAGIEAGSNPACPATGTHSVNHQSAPYDITSDAGLRNLAKRHIPAQGAVTTLVLGDFEALQHDVNQAFADAGITKTTFQPNRDALKHLAKTSGQVSEGDLVQLSTYLTIARAEGAESVNCGQVDGTDIHLAIGPLGATEYKGIVAEMIPQLPRPTGWDPATLNRLHTARLPILIVGGLTYDNEHLVNGDPNHPKSGQPKRMSLWEIHPIIEFYVCAADSCDSAHHEQWLTLTQWAAASPSPH